MQAAEHPLARDDRLKRKAVRVTGTGPGTGRSVASAAEAPGARVALLDNDFEPANAAARAVSGQVIAACCDVTYSDQAGRAADAVQAEFGDLHGFVCNAGRMINSPATTMTEDQWSAVLSVNLTGAFLTAREVGRRLLRQITGGTIVVTASMSAWVVVGSQRQCAYNASKAGVVALAQSLAVEWAGSGIRVNCVSPGNTRTVLVDSPDLTPQQNAGADLTPMGRLAEVDDLIGAYLLLLPDKSRFVTGHDLVADGGYTLW